MPFQNRVLYKCCLMMFKVKTNLVPSYVQTITPVSVVYEHNVRSAVSSDLYVSSANLKYYTRSCQYEVLYYGTISEDQSNSPQVYLYSKVDR